jgi:non-heme chloroperoxidase
VATFMTIDGAQLYYKDWGSGQPVFFCHGWPLNSDMWEHQMHALACGGFRCIAHDRRGFGRSSQPWEGYEYDTFADDVHALIEALELRDVILVGFSMGGGEVARYLGRHGSRRIAKAVLIAPATPVMARANGVQEGVDPHLFDTMRAALLADRPGFLRDFGIVLTGANRAGTPVMQPTLDWTQFIALQAGFKGTYDCIAALSETDFRADLTRFDVPTLVIHGDDDQVVPLDRIGRAAARAIPGARLEVYEGGAHALYITHLERLNRDLLAFARA